MALNANYSTASSDTHIDPKFLRIKVHCRIIFVAEDGMGTVMLKLNECRVLARLEHPNIIRFYSCWTATSKHSLAEMQALSMWLM